MRKARVLLSVVLLLGACDSTYERFSTAEEIRDVLVDAGIACDRYIDELAKHGPDMPYGSWGQCDTDDTYASFLVFPDKDALSWLKRAESRAQDDTPRQHWVYGENWFVGTNSQDLQQQVHDILGGGTASNTDF